jgi:zinc transport system substrate-binding protein
MKKLLFILISITITSTASQKLKIIVSIQPQLEFLSKIGGDRVDSSLMVQTGASPHSYAPKPSQMRAITKADLYLAIGVEFEKVWLDKFKNQNSNLLVVDISKDINKTVMQNLDPHIWVDPINVKQIAINIFEALSDKDSENRDYYKKNLDLYLIELDKLDKSIRDIFKNTPKDSKFMVFHPAWGYFAKRYNLQQLVVEVEGKRPKPRQLIKIIKEAKKERVKAIFTQPEFSDQSAKTIAKELGISVIKSSPLAKNWAENLLGLARAVAK